jgi:hypothetical protein
MLTHLKLDNFKIWRTTGPMSLAPVTLLLGTNSSGKSSLIQALLLIRQTVQGADANEDLNLGNPDQGDTVALGQFQDVLCRHGSSNRMGIEFRWSPTGAAADSALFHAEYMKGPAGSAELYSLDLRAGQQGFTVRRKKPGVYGLSLGNERRSRGQSADFRPERSFALSRAALERLGPAADQVREIGPKLLTELGRIVYLGPVRRLAQRDYAWNGRMPADIGNDGAKAVDALIAGALASGAKAVQPASAPAGADLFETAQHWLEKMGLADGLAVKRLGQSSRYELIVEYQGEQSNLSDVGVGVSQVLPVIVAAAYAPPGHIVIVEEPESHLHPLAQSILAELLVTVSRERNVQFIVETHSEHLFRRMQTLIANNEVGTDDCALYFLDRKGQDATLSKLHADEFGRIDNWPPNFFGDTLGETRRQAELAIRKMKERKTKNDSVSD